MSPCVHLAGAWSALMFMCVYNICTVEPLNKGHLGTQAAVPYSEVVPCWEVWDKIVIICTFTALMMYYIWCNEIIQSAMFQTRRSNII